MPTHIEIQNEQSYELDSSALQKASAMVLAGHDMYETGALTIVITDNDAVAALNQQYRGIDAPTDVLSFPAEIPEFELDDEDHDDKAFDQPTYLGDLLIAYPYAATQAEREGHTLMDSLMLLVIHGTLHLLGYDHDTPQNRTKMWSYQEAVLKNLGISPEIVPAMEQDTHDKEDR